MPRRLSGILELLLLLVGFVLAGIYARNRIAARLASNEGLREFSAYEGRLRTVFDSTRETQRPDFQLWSPSRIKAYNAAVQDTIPEPLAVLIVPKIHLEVPVYDGTDDVTLDRGAGRIVGTSLFDQEGNIGIAGHRDGFFRGLKDIGPGDTMELTTHQRRQTFVVNGIEIVDPNDVSVLRSRGGVSLTLVTCYPFYFVGHAPKRYIVEARLAKIGRQANPLHDQMGH